MPRLHGLPLASTFFIAKDAPMVCGCACMLHIRGAARAGTTRLTAHLRQRASGRPGLVRSTRKGHSRTARLAGNRCSVRSVAVMCIARVQGCGACGGRGTGPWAPRWSRRRYCKGSGRLDRSYRRQAGLRAQAEPIGQAARSALTCLSQYTHTSGDSSSVRRERDLVPRAAEP